MFFVSICTDMNALRESGLVADDSPYRGVIDGRSGAHVCYSADGSQSMIAITSIDGLENLQDLPYVLVHTPEEIFGYRRQVEVDGVLQFGEPTVTVTPAYTPSVVTGYEDDLERPVYKIVRHDKQKTVTRTHDEDGNEYPEPLVVPVVKVSYTYTEDGEIDQTIETPVMVLDYYETTDEIESYHQKAIYGPQQEWISPVMQDTGEVDEMGSPIYEEAVAGYYQDVVIPESSYETPNPVMEEIAGNADLRALYDLVYPRAPFTDEEGNTHIPPQFFAVPGGEGVDHILEA